MRSHRYLPRIVVAYLVIGLLFGCGLVLQGRWDAQCERSHPGTRWNGESWSCEVRS